MRPCPVCGGEKHTKFYHRDFSGMGEIVPFAHYDVLQCDTCGMMFAGNIVETMPLPAYYEHMSKYETTAFAKLKESDEVRCGFLPFLLDDITPQDSVLEVGCGEGSLLHILKEHGVRHLVGLEPSQKNCQAVQEHWGIRAVQGALGEEISGLAGETFDFIILEGVLEHLLSVQENLKQVLQYLAEGGKICFIVPDLAVFPEQNDFYQQFSVEHVNYFSMQSLTNLMRPFEMHCISHGPAGEAFYTLWQHDNVMTLPPPRIAFDAAGEQLMRQYLAQSKELSEAIRRKLTRCKGGAVYLWGAGTHTSTLCQEGLLDGIDVQAVVDSNVKYQGQTVYGIPVIAPEELHTRPVLPIVVSSRIAQEAIHTQITETMKLPHEVVRLY